MLLAKSWWYGKVYDRAYHYMCKALVSPPVEVDPSTKRWMRRVAPYITRIPGFSAFNSTIDESMISIETSDKINLEWAIKYKLEYETRRKSITDESEN